MRERMEATINLRRLFFICLVLFFCFQRVLVNRGMVFGYLDEFFAIAVAAEILSNIIRERTIFSRDEMVALLLMLLSMLIGLVSNYGSHLMDKPFFIAVDVISTYKVFLAYYWVRMRDWSREEWDSVFRSLAGIVRLLVIGMSCILVLAHLLHLDMMEDPRYGIPAFRFLFNAAGNYSKLFYFIIPLLSADLYYKNSRYKKAVLGLALVLWISTLRSRAIAFAVCYLFFVVWYFYLKDKQKVKIKVWQLLPFGLLGILLGWKQISFYFFGSTQARSVLLRYSLVTMADYFPWGSGFGTYGSDVAVKNYSPLYVKYNFRRIYGLGNNHANFANDNYWPMIIGQMGLFGTILIGTVLFLLYRYFIKNVTRNRFFHFATLCSIGFLLASSVASKSYSEYSMIPIFLLHGMMVQREKAAGKDG